VASLAEAASKLAFSVVSTTFVVGGGVCGAGVVGTRHSRSDVAVALTVSVSFSVALQGGLKTASSQVSPE
jgi:hypothetical protein